MNLVCACIKENDEYRICENFSIHFFKFKNDAKEIAKKFLGSKHYDGVVNFILKDLERMCPIGKWHIDDDKNLEEVIILGLYRAFELKLTLYTVNNYINKLTMDIDMKE